MNIKDMTRKQFDQLKLRKWDEDIGEFRTMVILPGRIKDMHDSGYRVMDFVAVNENNEPICRLSGCTDHLQIDGTGGRGRFNGGTWEACAGGWAIDCLPKSGLLRLFSNDQMTCDPALSSMSIFSRKKLS